MNVLGREWIVVVIVIIVVVNYFKLQRSFNRCVTSFTTQRTVGQCNSRRVTWMQH